MIEELYQKYFFKHEYYLEIDINAPSSSKCQKQLKKEKCRRLQFCPKFDL